MQKVITALGVLLFAFGGRPATASAQGLPTWLKVPAASAAGAPELDFERPSARGGESPRRHAFLTAAGIGLVAGGAVHTDVFGRKICYGQDDRMATAIPGGLAIAAAGIVMTTVGIVRLRRTERGRRNLRRGDAARLTLTSIGAGAAATTVLLSLLAFQVADCFNS